MADSQKKPPMHNLPRSLLAAVVLFGVGGCQANQAPPAAESPEPTLTPTMAPTSPSPMPAQRCEPLDEVFANMFVGLSEAALSNAEIAPEEFFTALAGNRETLELYLEALGIPVDDAWIDAAMSASLGQQLLRDGLDEGPNPSIEGEWVVCE